MDFRQVLKGWGGVVEKLSSTPPSPPHCVGNARDSPATEPFPGKGMHFLKGQAGGQWLSTKSFPNLTSKSKYALLSRRDPCSLKGC